MEENESKVLKSRVQTLEKELYIVIKELDHYRSKCKKLKLKLFKSKTSESLTVPHMKNLTTNTKLSDELGPQIEIQRNQEIKSQVKLKQNKKQSNSEDVEVPKIQTKAIQTDKKVTRAVKSPSKVPVIHENPPSKVPVIIENSPPVLPQKRQVPPGPSSSRSPGPSNPLNLSESVKKLKAYSESEEGEISETKTKKIIEKPMTRGKKNSVQKVMETIRLSTSTIKDSPEDLELFSLISKKPENLSDKDGGRHVSVNPGLFNQAGVGQSVQGVKPATSKRCKPAYNTRYTLEPAFEPTYKTFKANPIQMTPTTITLSQLTPIGQKIKENFDLIKRLYQTCYDFNYNNVYLVSQDFKTLDASTAASFLISEMMQLVYIFTAFDALALLYGVVKDLIRKNSWDLEFLKAIRNFFVSRVEDVWFANCPSKLPSLGVNVSSMNDVIHACFVLHCKENGYLILVAKMLAKLVLYKNTRLITQTFSILGESAREYYSLWILQRFYGQQENSFKIMQELVEKAFTHDENLQMNIYLSFKSILRFLDPKDAYDAYVQILWPIIKENRDSFGRVLVLKLMTVLYLIFEREKKKKTSDDIKKKLEDVLTDKEFKSKKYSDFNKKEIEVVQRGLIKIANSTRSTA
jgi:hypothetical protein